MSQTAETTPILWIVGSLGTGKSDTSYPDNHRVKSAAMAAAWSVYEAHGATGFVVSGGINTSTEKDLHQRQIPHAEWCVVRLRISASERRRRTEARGRLLGQDRETIEAWIEAGIDDEAALEATPTFADFTVDTDGLGQQHVVDRVLQVTAWPSRIRP